MLAVKVSSSITISCKHTHSDPARINRVDDLGSPGALGVGRFNKLQVVPANTSVTLFCPTSGIPTPMDSWRRVTVNELGMAMEVVITGEEDGLSL